MHHLRGNAQFFSIVNKKDSLVYSTVRPAKKFLILSKGPTAQILLSSEKANVGKFSYFCTTILVPFYPLKLDRLGDC